MIGLNCSARLDACRFALVVCALFASMQAPGSQNRVLFAAEPLVIEVEETSGTTRAGSPVAYRIELQEPLPRSTPIALFSADGEPVGAQVSPADELGRNTKATARDWWLDFNCNSDVSTGGGPAAAGGR